MFVNVRSDRTVWSRTRVSNSKESIVEPQHTTEIIVNGRPRSVAGSSLTFEQVIEIAFPGGGGPNIVFTVTYRKGDPKKEGSLVPGQSVPIVNGMIFDVTRTDKS
jgi:hypothetical protein